MEYTVNGLARLAGVTARTLRWYDQLGLLVPARRSGGGYRVYGPEEVDRLQQILFYRELGLELSAIRAILDDPAFDRQAALQSHLAELEERRTRLDALILTVKKTLKGADTMSDEERFEGFKQKAAAENEARYGAELRQTYGADTVERANARLLALTREEYDRWQALGEEIRSGLESAVRAGRSPAGEEGARIAQLHRRWLSYSWETYDPKAHRGLAALYTEDPRFTAYYDKEVSGCAAFLRAAIEAHI